MADLTLLDEIIQQVSAELYQKWYNAPTDLEKTNEWIQTIWYCILEFEPYPYCIRFL